MSMYFMGCLLHPSSQRRMWPAGMDRR